MGTIMTCSICIRANHNKRNCPKNLKPNPSMGKRWVEVNMKEQAATTLVQEEVHEVVTKRGQELWDKVYLLLILNIHVLMLLIFQQGLASSRRVNTGVQSSAHVTCDINFKPTKGLKWKSKHVMTQRELQVQSVMRRIQTRSKVVGIQTRAQAKEKSPSKKNS
ncbi:hypothetical protein H5410_041792 [Solanum commersonii]|uniref:Uncharacterized protein n=1 Tax=Solanum commersonii TaxID=4109 RepID=A0A9J5XWL3_SOLCO|nr:hypothetical protein H5410_041792 [Solanum commersonii]